MKFLILLILLGGLAGAGMMLWLGIKNAQKHFPEDNKGGSNDR